VETHQVLFGWFYNSRPGTARYTIVHTLLALVPVVVVVAAMVETHRFQGTQEAVEVMVALEETMAELCMLWDILCTP